MSSLKLEFLTEAMEYLRPVLRETKTVEETAEAIIPDSCPDVAEILYTDGLSYLRGKELSEGAVSVSAGVSASVLCKPDGRKEPEVVEVYIPLSLRLENHALKPGLLCSVQVQLRRLDSHMVNPRKVLVRATVAVTVWVWEPCREEHPRSLAAGEAELLLGTAPMKLLGALGEKNYTAEDSLRLSPDGHGLRLVSCGAEITHQDARLTGARAVFKGTVKLTALYLSDGGALETGTAQLPFSQYIDLGDCRETDELRLYTCLTGADIELTADGGGLNAALQLMTRAEVYTMRELSYIKDLYSLRGEASPMLEKRHYESLLDRQYFAPTGRGSVPLGGSRVVLCTCEPGEISHARSGETTTFTLPVTVQVLTEDNGDLRGGSTRVELTCSTQASPGCRFEAAVEGLQVTSSTTGEAVEVQVTGEVSVSTYATGEIDEIAGAEVTELEPSQEVPGLIIRRPKPGESLWSLAKHYRTTMSAISAANGLEGEPTPDMLLLIPGNSGRPSGTPGAELATV